MPTLRILVASVLLASTPALAHAQASASQPATGSSTIFLPIVLGKETDLDFGTIARPSSGTGTITIDPANGARSLAGQGALLSNTGASQAAFTVGGESGQTFSITAPETMTMTREGGGETIVVTLTPSAAEGLLAGPPGGPGSASFGVGGELSIANTTVTGAYGGSFTVTVAYN
ncbi:DUF4402 domain-containing protein [Phenylobacterium sp.]|uniref:DUF4402 domain-containing protein n=1 Tax=Phenylobacterium sp. TaxID=1871053 RepID=UPI00281233E8|nr:DUF4402 domain-containing protein [Phenylobacterium sp.]